MAKKKKDKKENKSKVGWRLKLFIFLFCVGAVLGLKQSCILLLIGLLPAIVAYIVDTTPTQAWFKTVFCFNLAGILPYIAELYFTHGNSLSAMQKQVSDIWMWLMVYLAAGAGWLTIWLCAKGAHSMIALYTSAKIEGHRKKIKKIEQEWGIPPRPSHN